VRPKYERVGGWPPYVCFGLGLILDPFSIPMLNTILLLSSGFSITLGHYGLLFGGSWFFLLGLVVTLLWGILFLLFQLDEYLVSGVRVNSFVFGRVFFLLTGFHGMHVFVGLCFIVFSFFRFKFFVRLGYGRWGKFKLESNFARKSHLGFEVAVWYWHFVDVV